MNSKLRQRMRLIVLSILCIFLFWPEMSDATQWVNPKEFFKDDLNLVRKPREKNKLTDVEKNEIETYGFTGLELMTYLFCSREAGNLDRDSFCRFYNVTPDKKLFRVDFFDRYHYDYRDKKELIKNKPGDIYRK